MDYSLDIGGIRNVFYEQNSDSAFENLNEKQFLIRFFMELKLICENFDNYNFYIYTTNSLSMPPNSFDWPNTGRDILFFLSDEMGELPLHLRERYKCIFKPYLKNNYDNIYTFPLGYVTNSFSAEYVPISQRKHNVFFSGNLNLNRIDFYRKITNSGSYAPNNHLLYYLCKKILFKFPANYFMEWDACFKNSIIRFTENFKNGFPIDEYSKILSQSKIVLCPKGFHSTECFRHYEALKQGCVVISEKLPNTYLYNKSPIIQIENWSEIKALVADLIEDEPLLIKKSEEALHWYESVMSEKATAKYVMNKIKQ